MEYLQEQDAALSQTQTRNTWGEQQLTDCHRKKIGQRTGLRFLAWPCFTEFSVMQIFIPQQKENSVGLWDAYLTDPTSTGPLISECQSHVEEITMFPEHDGYHQKHGKLHFLLPRKRMEEVHFVPNTPATDDCFVPCWRVGTNFVRTNPVLRSFAVTPFSDTRKNLHVGTTELPVHLLKAGFGRIQRDPTLQGHANSKPMCGRSNNSGQVR